MAYKDILEAFGDSTRRDIFDRLRAGPQSVTTISCGLPVSRPAVSQHLKVLKDAGLVKDQAHGSRRLYRIDHAGLAELRDWLDRIQDEAEAAYRAEIQRQMDERRDT